MDKKVIIVILIMIGLKSFSQEIKLFKEINTGNNKNELGYESRRSIGGGVTGPMSFLVRDNIYIPDPINDRFTVFDKDLVYKKLL